MTDTERLAALLLEMQTAKAWYFDISPHGASAAQAAWLTERGVSCPTTNAPEVRSSLVVGSPAAPREPSEAAVLAAWAHDDNVLSVERVRWLLRAAYAVDFGDGLRASPQEGT